ncbi:MAG: dinitrogenase iron-molybdenum cofactor biosynthesis protein [Ruminococcus sp.]|nr:dinitrogenase iron-molybdenum cofactor biosynthesis protein [Ruminococcus sp.]
MYKIAFASSDGVNVDCHFGAAKSFYIFTLDEAAESYGEGERIDVTAPCHGGSHLTSGFELVLKKRDGVSAVAASRAGPGAVRFLNDNGIAVYQLPGTIDEAFCRLLEERKWEVDKWQSHTNS